MPTVSASSRDETRITDEVERAAFSLKAMQMKLYRRGMFGDDLRPHVLTIKVHVPEEYFDLRIPAEHSTTLIETVPTLLHPSERDALDVNPLLSDLCLILTGQNNRSADYRHVQKAVAIALRDEYRDFVTKHLRLQPCTYHADGWQSAGTSAARICVTLLPPPGQIQLLQYDVFVQNSPLEDVESQGLMRHRTRAIEALVLTGQTYHNYPIGLLYKAVARAFKSANLIH